MAQLQDEVADAARSEANAYRNGADRPLDGYALLMAVFTSVIAGA